MSAVTPVSALGKEAIEKKGWWRAHAWLIARRFSQLGILGLFALASYKGVGILKGNLSSSLLLDTIPLSDPFLLMQSIFTGHFPERTACLGAGIIVAFYLLFGGRTFCSWVCPVNLVTDAAAFLRRKLGLKGGRTPHPNTRYWLLGMVMVLASLTGVLAWEWVNPVTIFQRGLIFGFGLAWGVIGAVFLYDLFIASRGWCGHVCPQGAFYSLLGRVSPVCIEAVQRDACDDCMECFAICPEPQVIRPALKAQGQSHAMILDSSCTHCARCVDICGERVFKVTMRFARSKP